MRTYVFPHANDEWEKRTRVGGGDAEEPCERTSRRRDFAYSGEPVTGKCWSQNVGSKRRGAAPNDDVQRFSRTLFSHLRLQFVLSSLLSVPLQVLHLMEPVMSFSALILSPLWVGGCTQKNAYPAIIDAFSPLLHKQWYR
ncbi:hypothetical protein CNMCM5793_000372 [Aspergillus hiratsukae]|uniref:Uncharacterized protein n=1 Tax=Aspergillus hiratsukae TaxID=1194566 RepID=A0A8H6UTA4_9EURO|nr:hypothetical protein CNMCM5793_000372 [Aspergillus hiratsukae]KAF7166092.1 hypothetical protein CNMCM6106_002050 [Aspergillus hiratsukae]